MAAIARDELRDLARQCFMTRELTLEDAGRRYEVPALQATVLELREAMRATLASLPDHAFERRATGEGEEQWAAGQVIAHIANASAFAATQLAPALGFELATPASYDITEIPDRAQALAIADAVLAGTRDFFAALPADLDLERTLANERFGDLGLRGYLMLTAIHDGDHLGQLARLGA